MPLAYDETIMIRHDVVRTLFLGLPSDLRGSLYLVPYLKRCLTVTGGGCLVDAPVSLELFLGKSLSFVDEQSCKTAPRPVQKVQIKFMKSYFAGRIQ